MIKKLLLLLTICNTLLFSNLPIGGNYNMLLSVDKDRYKIEKLKTESSKLQFALSENNISVDSLILKNNYILIQTTSSKQKLMKLLHSNFSILKIKNEKNQYKLTLSNNLNIEKTVDKKIKYLKKRYKMLGIYILDNWFTKALSYIKHNHTSVVIEKRDNSRIYIKVENANDYMKNQYIKDQLNTSSFGFYKVIEKSSKEKTSQKVAWVDKAENHLYLSTLPIVTQDMILNSSVGFNINNNAPLINFQLNELGTKIFAQYSRTHTNQRLAIVINQKIYSAPTIREGISDGMVQITGNFTIQEAQNISNNLNTIYLPLGIEKNKRLTP